MRAFWMSLALATLIDGMAICAEPVPPKPADDKPAAQSKAVPFPTPDTSKDDPLPAVFAKVKPESVEDFKAIQARVATVLAKALPCSVGTRMGGGSGSGVIISPDGYVLTAGHISGEPNRDITILLPDGRSLKAKTLGGDARMDSGLLKIIDPPANLPFVEVGRSSDLKKGSWVVMTGHPGGFRPDRPPVVRVGRVLEPDSLAGATLIRTDCTMVGGDSGGPLFDMYGRVVGIHSRIQESITTNIHVPSDLFRDNWGRLIAGERWGSGFGRSGRPTTPAEAAFGFRLDPAETGCKVGRVVSDSPAATAGLKPGDVIEKLDGKPTATAAALAEEFKAKTLGSEVTFEIRRGSELVTLKLIPPKSGS